MVEFKNIYKDKIVLVTGHTGFKGSWLSYWLKKLGAKVIGYSLESPTEPNHFSLINIDIESIIGDIRDYDTLLNVFKTYKPEIVFHLAAQPLVRHSYRNPIETYETNIMGTVNIFEVSKITDVKAIVNITSDKCYENKEWVWGYKEIDQMGGYDPYSASKGCAELITSSYQSSFFNVNEYNKTHNTLLSSCRAGNVIGGGDWSEDRLIPDIIRSIVSDKKLEIRSPNAIRPWQHVLEPLGGYLLVGQKLLEGKKEFACAWNFGPNEEQVITVEEVVKKVKQYWNKFNYEVHEDCGFHEAGLLKLDCSKAHSKLNWFPKWGVEETFKQTILWYKSYYEDSIVKTQEQLEYYIKGQK